MRHMIDEITAEGWSAFGLDLFPSDIVEHCGDLVAPHAIQGVMLNAHWMAVLDTCFTLFDLTHDEILDLAGSLGLAMNFNTACSHHLR